MRDVKKIERKLCLTNSAAAKICSIANKKGEEKNKIFAAKQMLVYYLGDILVILRKDSYTPDDILLLILKTSMCLNFDTKEILGASPYWRSDVMKNEFKKVSSPQERHDYVVYKMHEDILNQRYHESVQTVLAELKKVIPRIELTGQWSVDVMRNGNDYYIIDMALAENSALNDCVPKNLLRAYPQQWLPGESNS